MNQFSSLDNVFPCIPHRMCGEVVRICVSVFHEGAFKGELSWKRKAWYVNASVNAWHLHRGLCRDLRELAHGRVPGVRINDAKRLLAADVLKAYLANHETGRQNYHYRLDFYTLFDGTTRVVSVEAPPLD